MADFDGQTFGVIHKELVGENQPLDSMADLAIRAQLIELARERGAMLGLRWRRMNNTPSGYIYDRPWASFRWLCFWATPFWVAPDLSKITVTLLGRVDSADPSDPNATVEIKLDLEGVGSKTISHTMSAGGDYEHIEIALPITQKPTQTIPSLLKLWMRSAPLAEIEVVDAADLIPDVPASGPTAADLTVLGYRGERIEYDTLVHLSSYATGALNAMRLLPANLAQDTPYRRVYLSYLQVRGLFLRTEHDPRPPVKEAFRPAIKVKGSTEGQHVLMQRRVAKRPRPISLGVRGFIADDPAEYVLYHEMWRYIRADEETDVGTDLFPLWESVRFDDVGGTLEVVFWVLPYFYVEDFTADSLEALLDPDNLASCEWEFTLALNQAGGATFGSLVKTITFEHIATETSGKWPQLLQLHWRHRAVPAAAHPDNRYFTCKEGALYGADFALLRPVRMSFDLDALDVAAMAESLELMLSVACGNNPTGGIPGTAANQMTTYLAIGPASATHFP